MGVISTTEPEGEELIRWLEEAGRRKIDRAGLEHSPQGSSGKNESPKPRRRRITQPELLCLFAIAAASHLVYYFTDVQLQIASLSSVVFFVPT